MFYEVTKIMVASVTRNLIISEKEVVQKKDGLFFTIVTFLIN